AVAPAHVGRLQLSKGRANLYLGAIRRCENRAVTHGITDIDRVFRSNAAHSFSPVLSSKQNFFRRSCSSPSAICVPYRLRGTAHCNPISRFLLLRHCRRHTRV